MRININSIDLDLENKNLEIDLIKINENEYNERVYRVIKWLLELNIEIDNAKPIVGSVQSMDIKEAA